jgi:6-pyruvoyltetrahydropterin/6-carboxytetrahydropterin synthase
MFTITKQFAFEAAHRLLHLEPGHPCAALHGHSYRAEVVIEALVLGPEGFAGGFDYRSLDALKAWIDANLDHAALLHRDDPILCHVEAVTGIRAVRRMPVNPTAENLAHALYERTLALYPALNPHGAGLARLVAVRVSETQKTWAEYKP